MAVNSKNMSFSRAELAVVKQLARGYSEKEIADKLSLCHLAVNNHLRSVLEKNGV